ncbi:MAG: hypothetical protein KKA73_20545, partial [Chloroflexi bacterium]|nr:hypothetical protein [Chloroflexota bacterium]
MSTQSTVRRSSAPDTSSLDRRQLTQGIAFALLWGAGISAVLVTLLVVVYVVVQGGGVVLRTEPAAITLDLAQGRVVIDLPDDSIDENVKVVQWPINLPGAALIALYDVPFFPFLLTEPRGGLSGEGGISTTIVTTLY